jgi:NADH-quinone oxidoreductase subunit M
MLTNVLQFPWLSSQILTPIIGAVLVLLCGEKRVLWARVIALMTALLTLAMCVPLYVYFDSSRFAMQFTENHAWIPAYDIHYTLGVDGISMPLVLLTVVTTLLVILASWRTVQFKVAQYLATFLIMQGMIVGIFCALDAMLFYVFWEATLIPMYLSIGIWGSQNRSYAAIKFFLFTFFGSALMLAALLYMAIKSHQFNILGFYPLSLSMHEQIWIFVAFLLAFAVKIPMWPVHTWLPDAHTEAPAGGSVILAALMLKMGGYGLIRFNLPITPDASGALDWLMIALSLLAIVYIGYIAIAQTDMKKLIAYSSVAHMGFVTLGCFLVYVIVKNIGSIPDAYMALEGGMVQMISHAFGSGAMFLGFGLLYQQMHTRKIADFGGIAKVMPVFTAFFVLFAFSNVGLPGTSGFVGEFMVLVSAFKASPVITMIAALTLIIGAAYTLWMVKRVFYGAVASDQVANLRDVSGVDWCVFVLLAAMLLGLGVYPNVLLDVMHSSVGHTLHLALSSKLT